MTETTYSFIPSATQAFQFQATFDGTQYLVQTAWNIFGLRYYINVFDQYQNLIFTAPLIGSPVDQDISLTAGYFKTVMIYRPDLSKFIVR